MAERYEARRIVEELMRSAARRPVPPPVVPAIPPLDRMDHVVHHPDLAYANGHWNFELPGSRRTILDRLRRRIREIFLGSYIDEERELLRRFVRIHNDIAKRSDWLLEEIRTVDAALRQTTDTLRATIDAFCQEAGRLSERDDALHGVLEARIEALERALRNAGSRTE